jgi:uncharacterized protein YndB with AHSA1/START domain
MRAFVFTSHIARPPDAVWDFMMDRRNSPRWNNLVRSVEVITPGPVRVGTELLVTLDARGRTLQLTSEVWVVERPYRYGVRNTRHNVTGVFEYRLRPEGAGTQMEFQCDIHPHGWMWLALPFLIRDSRVRYTDQLANLKRVIEAQS